MIKNKLFKYLLGAMLLTIIMSMVLKKYYIGGLFFSLSTTFLMGIIFLLIGDLYEEKHRYNKTKER